MKKRNIILAILAALLVVGGAVACTKQPEPETKPTISEVETPVEQPVETPAETPIEGDTAVEGQPAADETTATGNLGGSVGENNFGMTNLMDSIKDNNQTDVEHSLDLEEQKQETPVEGAVGSSNGTGTGTQTGVSSGNEGSGTGTGNSNGSGTQPQTPVGNQNQLSEEEQEKLKEDVNGLSFVTEVGGYNEEIGGVEFTTDLGDQAVMLPGGAAIQKELWDILKQYQ